MKVNTVDENRIDIILSQDEIDDIFGGYEFINYETPYCRTQIHNLLASAIPSTLLPLDCERVLIEVKPRKFGCTISLTKLYSHTKKLRKPDRTQTITLIFENSDSLILSLEALNTLECFTSELYTRDQKYALILSVRGISHTSIIHIGEYCKTSLKDIDAVKIREYWLAVCENEAIEKLALAFLK